MNQFLYLVIVLFSISSCKQSKTISLRTGDLLFQDLDCGALCDAIENATIGKNGERFSHIGIVSVEGKETYVIEAYDGVSKTPISEFLKRNLENSKSKVEVGRLMTEYQHTIPSAIKEATKRIGLPYDDEFKLDNNKYYCSEFIYDIFKVDNKSIFRIKPMTFVNQVTGKTDQVWKTHFKEIGISIPEGELGCNPIDYYQSDKVLILGLVVE